LASQCPWWMLFQIRVVCTKFDIYEFILCQSQARTWICNVICRHRFCVQWVKMSDDCSLFVDIGGIVDHHCLIFLVIIWTTLFFFKFYLENIVWIYFRSHINIKRFKCTVFIVVIISNNNYVQFCLYIASCPNLLCIVWKSNAFSANKLTWCEFRS